MNRLNKGFTLIELLVVIAIIGILSSVVLASLNTARSKGSDASVKSNLNGARAQAELFYDTAQTYDGVCAALSTATPGGISNLVLAAARNLSSSAAVVADATAFTYSASGAAGSSACHDSGAGWAAIVSLKSPTTTSAGWCVDSTGNAKESTALAANVVVCP